MSRQAQLGLFSVIAVALLFGIFYVITDFGTRHSGYRFGVHFASAAGLPTGAQVFFSGVTVGTVDQVRLLPDNSVDVIMAIQSDIRIPKGSRFLIQAPITGTPSLIITPPMPQPLPPGVQPTPLPAEAIWPATELPLAEQPNGYAAPTFGDMMQQGQSEVKRIDTMLSTLQAREPVLLNGLQTTLDNMNTMTSELKGTVANLSGTLDSTMQAASGHIVDMTATMDSTLTRNQYKIDSILTSLDRTAVALNKSMDSLQSMAADPRLKNNLVTTTANIRDLTANIAGLTSDMRDITGNAQTKAQLRDTVMNLDATMQKADSLLGTLGGRSHVYGLDAGATPYPVPKSPNSLPPPGTQTPPPPGSEANLRKGLNGIIGNLVQVQVRLGYLSKQTTVGTSPLLTSDRGPQADINVIALPHGQISGMFGANDIGGRTTWNLMGIKNAGPLHAGGGVLYSQIGGTVWYDGRPVGLETRVYNLRRPMVDLYGNFNLGQWAKLFLGQRDITHPDRRTVYGLQLNSKMIGTEQTKPRVGIIGSGAMGTLFGFHLAQHCEVTMLDSNAGVLSAIEKHRGLSVNDARPRPVRVGRSARDLFGSTVVFLFVKAVDTLRALRPFAGELSPSTPIVSLQNGVGNEDAIKTALGGAVPVVLGITTESSLTVAPGKARSSEEGNTIIGSGGASPATSRGVAELLTKSGLRASVVYDIRPHLWGKLVANAAINAVSAMLDCESGTILKDPNAARLAEALAEEAAAVAASLKINLPFVNPWQYVTEVIAVGADSKSSMAFDLESGHPSEIDHINGAVCAAGRRTGVATPYNDAMVRLIKAKEALR